MEADAPEKIYFTQTENGTHYYTDGIPFERKYIEYVRKDAFIKKVIMYLIHKTRTTHYSFGDKRELFSPNLEVVIEDFKKYINGE